MLSTSADILFITQTHLARRYRCTEPLLHFPLKMAGYLEQKVTRVRSISDHFVGANEFSDHGRPSTRVELMVDFGNTATVCGLEHFSDTPVTVGTSDATSSSNGQPLKHCGQKKVELFRRW